ncbi:MAG: AAA family ATPase [Bacteroidota bacterium]
MLIRFTLENWMSFRDPVTFSMIAGREEQHRERVPRVEKYRLGLLPVAAIYGGNASGKTNFFKALNFARNFVVRGTRHGSPIPVDVFRLDPQKADAPARLTFELLVSETVYEYSFAVTRKTVLEEKLVRITSASEKVLYDRHGDDPRFDRKLPELDRLNFVFQGTRDNQLFLTNAVSQKVDTFKPIHDWFDNLTFIAPDSRFEPFELFFDEGDPLYAAMNELLPRLDTGIARLGGEEIAFENVSLPEPVKKDLQENVGEGITVRVQSMSRSDRFTITRKDGELRAKKLFTYHPRAGGAMAAFDLSQESDGTQRVIDLLPAFVELTAVKTQKVYVIDELDRSLHTLLTRNLLESFLVNCTTASRSQLLFTTHDVLLMDQSLLRRDEMWVAERDQAGVSNLISFNEYKDVRSDRDVRKSYLQGRLGGIPRILLSEAVLSSLPQQLGMGEK